jgi:hypothetical protein
MDDRRRLVLTEQDSLSGSDERPSVRASARTVDDFTSMVTVIAT